MLRKVMRFMISIVLFEKQNVNCNFPLVISINFVLSILLFKRLLLFELDFFFFLKYSYTLRLSKFMTCTMTCTNSKFITLTNAKKSYEIHDIYSTVWKTKCKL